MSTRSLRPKSAEPASTQAQRRTEFDNPQAFARFARQQLGGRVGVAVAGYSAPPKGTPYEANTGRFLESFVKAGSDRFGFVTSPTATSGSVDALTTVAAHASNTPVVYVTAKSYLEYIDTKQFPKGVDLARFNATPVHFEADAADYSVATSAGSSALLVTGGRDTTVSDFMHSIRDGDKVVILADKGVVSRDASGAVQTFDAKGRVANASHYLAGVISSLARGETPSFRALESVGFDAAWVSANRSKLLKNVLIVDASDVAASGRKAAEFVRAGATGSTQSVNSSWEDD